MEISKPVAAFDVGGTKIALALVSTNGQILSRTEQLTLRKGPQENIIQMVEMLQALLKARGQATNDLQGIGVGLPAVLESGTDRVVWAPNLYGWHDIDLAGALQDRLGLSVCLEYDGHTATLGEWWVGAGCGYSTFVDVIIGTGIGGGMVLDGRLYRGPLRLAGTAGWFALTTNPRRGGRHRQELGHWESLAAGPGITRYARQLAHRFPASLLFQDGPPGTWTLQLIFSRAQQNDILAVQVCTRLADLIGIGLSNIVSLINPPLIILGGGVGSHVSMLLPQIRSVIEAWSQPYSAQNVEVVTSSLGAEAGLIGAAYAFLLRQKGE